MWNLFKVDGKYTRTMLLTSFWCVNKLKLHTSACYSVSIADFEQVNAGCLIHYQVSTNVVDFFRRDPISRNGILGAILKISGIRNYRLLPTRLQN